MEGFDPCSIERAVWIIKQLESHIDRFTQHSPYTIGKASS